MWVAKLKIKHKDCWISHKTEKYNVSIKGVPLNTFEQNERYYHTNIIFLSGDKKEQQKLISDLKNDKKIKNIIIRGSQIISLVEGQEFISTYFDPSFFFIKPVIIEKGFEYWEIGCWERKKIINFYEKIKGFAEVKILKLKKQFPQVFIQQAVEKLTTKQQEAFEYARKSGYYKYPREVSVEELAKMKKTPRTTFQSHLRKAETKILNVILE